MVHGVERGCYTALRRRSIRLAAAVSVTAILAACQTGGPAALSLEEAKQVTAEFSGSFTPPPRTSNDILSSFGEADFKNYSCEQDPPLRDWEVRAKVQAIPFTTKFGRRIELGRVGFLAGLSLQEFYKGNYPRSVKFAKWAIGQIPDGWRTQFVKYQGRLAAIQA